MDPNANLQEQMRLAARIIEAFDNERPIKPEDCARLAELTIALRDWLAGGGFAPEWSKA